MLVNTAWLLDYLEPHVPHDRLVETFTAIGLEVEEAIDLKKALEPIRIGFLRSIEPLEGAEGMFVTQVEIAEGETIQIVCGSEHPLETGWGVPVATEGVTLPTGAKIKEGKIRGTLSQGMICLDGELGLVARETGLTHTSDESHLGKPLPEVIDIEEWLVDLAVLANRPDCLGVIGIAREVAAALDLKWKLPTWPTEYAIENSVDDAPFELTIHEPQLCPRYLGLMLDGIDVQPSPHWLKSRLIISGSRPINNVVDITNFVLYEFGQPLHAFDANTLEGPAIHVRTMTADETLTLLDEQEISGETQPLVIADAERPIALAGIMGGAETQTTAETNTVLLEAACFDPVQIRTTKRQFHLLTDSAYRFERGTDPNDMLTWAMSRAASLLEELANAKPSGPIVERYPNVKEPQTVPLSAERVSKYFGADVASETIREALTKLDMQVDDDLNVTVPTFRVDVNDPVVLIEDVIRMVGYGEVPITPMAGASTSGGRSAVDALKNFVAAHLSANGFLECRKAPLVDAKSNVACVAAPEPVTVQNPMRVDMAVLRTSLLPGLLQTADLNARRGEESFRFYEIDRSFAMTDGEPIGIWQVGGVIGGSLVETDWTGRRLEVDFYLAKGVVENLLEAVGVEEATFHAADRPGFLTGQLAEIRSKSGTLLGTLGALDPATKFLPDQYGKTKYRGTLYGFELNLEALVPFAERIVLSEAVARTPQVDRDLAVVAKREIAFGSIAETIRAAAGSHLESLTITDLYAGEKIGADERSMTVRLVFRDAERTLTAEEVQDAIDTVTESLAKIHQARIRA